MKPARILSLFLVVTTLLGCALTEPGSDESLGQSQSELLKGIVLLCVRDRSDLPDGHNIDSWLIECLGGGGEAVCSGDTPMCCKEQSDGAKACSDDPGDVVRDASVDLGTAPIGGIMTADPGGKPAVAGQTDLPELLIDPSLSDEAPSTEPDLSSLARTKGEDLEVCLHNCPTEPGRVEKCRRNCMCLTGHRPRTDCDLIDLFQ
jgi:hypothetical protein